MGVLEESMLPLEQMQGCWSVKSDQNWFEAAENGLNVEKSGENWPMVTWKLPGTAKPYSMEHFFSTANLFQQAKQGPQKALGIWG